MESSQTNSIQSSLCDDSTHAEATSEPSDKAATEPALQLLKDNLPSYIVSCFLASGYDSLPVIAEMDASDGPGNAIQGIEDFINEQYPGDPLYTRGRKVCKFPPGHRIRRTKRFVELVKEKNREPESKMTFHIKRSKRMKYTADDDSSASEQLCEVNQFSILCNVRQHLAKWQRSCQNLKIKALKEYEHFCIGDKETSSRDC